MRLRSAVLAAMLGMGAALTAFEERPLPPFTVTSAAGAPVASSALSGESRWVMLYVTPDCRSCTRVLRALKDWQSERLIARTVVVVRGRADQAAPYIAQQLPPEVAAIRWHADEEGQAWRALELKGTPVLMGIDNGKIKWTLAGVLNDPKALESVVRTWVEY
jgi:hypothetical protein